MKKYIAIILIGILMTAGCGDSSSTGNKALDGDLELESNQSLIIAQVTAIYGNEITLALAKEVDESESNGEMKEEGDESTMQDPSATNADQDGTTTNEDASSTDQDGTATNEDVSSADQDDTTTNEDVSSTDQDDTTTNKDGSTTNTNESTAADNETSSNDAETNKHMTSGDNVPSRGDMPEGGNAPSESDMPQGNGENSDGGNSSSEKDSSDKSHNKEQTQMTRYTLTGEELTTTIPVGTPVTTLLGTVTTFSRIAVENTLKIVTETNEDGEDVIVAIYIVG